jgi:hypothetical protein
MPTHECRNLQRTVKMVAFFQRMRKSANNVAGQIADLA